MNKEMIKEREGEETFFSLHSSLMGLKWREVLLTAAVAIAAYPLIFMALLLAGGHI